MIWFALNFRFDVFQAHEHPAVVQGGAAAAPMTDMKPSTFGSARDNFHRGKLVFAHRVEGNVLRRLGDGENPAGVFVGEKSLGNHDEQKPPSRRKSTSDTSIVAPRWRMTICNVRS